MSYHFYCKNFFFPIKNKNPGPTPYKKFGLRMDLFFLQPCVVIIAYLRIPFIAYFVRPSREDRSYVFFVFEPSPPMKVVDLANGNWLLDKSEEKRS